MGDLRPRRGAGAFVLKVRWKTHCEICDGVLQNDCAQAKISVETHLPEFFVPYYWMSVKCPHSNQQLLESVYHGAGIRSGESQSFEKPGGGENLP